MCSELTLNLAFTTRERDMLRLVRILCLNLSYARVLSLFVVIIVVAVVVLIIIIIIMIIFLESFFFLLFICSCLAVFCILYSQCKNCHGHPFIIPHTAECVVLILFVIFLIDIFSPVLFTLSFSLLHTLLSNGHLHLDSRPYVCVCVLSAFVHFTSAIYMCVLCICSMNVFASSIWSLSLARSLHLLFSFCVFF